ncbi:related to Symplekin [Moesziomyces antarcticus]|uniref:Related to Symplekin n=1 Tax=Pseudozyma antarctica TaxID=84753 RepID=A0A5C3FYP0_PSEA2|nr:related to Symplekin [Moesziomyces antarcticus]
MAAPANTDALGLLSAALNSHDKQQEARHLSELYNLLKAQPGNVPILLPSLISLLPKASTSLRTWIAQVMDLAFCRPSLSQDTKATLASHAPDAILLLIKDRDPRLTKIAAQCFASMYPVLFRLVCNERAKSSLWQTVQAIKVQVVHLFDNGSLGTKLAVIKCYQRIESNRLFTQTVTLIFTSDVVDLIMASVNSLTVLAKSRPQLGSVILRAMATWTPASLNNLSHTQVRNVEKTVRIFYLHFVRNQLAGPESSSLQKALETQQRRMEEAAKAYQAEGGRGKARSEQDLHAAITNMRANLPPDASTSAQSETTPQRAPGPAPGPPPPRPATTSDSAQLNGNAAAPLVKLEHDQESTVQDPLQMDMAEEDLDLLEASGRDRARAESANGQDDHDEELSMAVIENFALAPPDPRRFLASSTGAHALWSSLVIRLATRGFAEPPGASDEASAGTAPETKVVGGVAPTRTLATQADIIRALMLEFVRADVARRTRFAVNWMGRVVLRPRASQASWLGHDHQGPFLADLPEIAPAVLDLVAELSKDKLKMIAGMSTLQDICMSRPALRDQAADKLLQLTRTSERTEGQGDHCDQAVRHHHSALEATILAFARSNLDILTDTPQPPEAAPEAKPEADAVNGDEPGTAQANGSIPEMLDEIFAAYPRTPKFVQAAIEEHIVNLIRALGPNHPRLLTLLRNFPEGADSLALCILKTLTEKNRAPALVEVVKELVDTRDVDPRFLVPVMADLDKAEIMKRLPKVVTILASRAPEDRALIKSTELLTPVELMGLLHRAEREIGLKNTVAAIQICFGMTDVYRSEVLAAVLNQISEDQNLPMLFMRTVIMAVSTYKSLSGYVARNLLSRLITKKIWQNPPLWDGFILCAKQTAPSSFGALIQLPRDQLREVVSRQPDLRTGLVEYLTAKGGQRARLATFMDMLGPDPEDPASAADAATA